MQTHQSKLKPNFQTNLSKEDFEFVIELSLIGYINILTNQVVLLIKSCNGNPYISFTQCGNKTGFQMPKNWAIEYMSADENEIRITFIIIKDDSISK